MSRIETMIAARKRGVTTTAIAKGLGVSHQAVSASLRRHNISGKRYYPNRHRTMTPLTCPVCSKVRWRSRAELADLHGQYCSQACYYIGQQKVSDDDVMRVVDMRLAGMTWTVIGKKLGVSFQSLQRRLWIKLHERGLLKREVVYQIWGPTTSEFRKRAKWNWLENMTGLICE